MTSLADKPLHNFRLEYSNFIMHAALLYIPLLIFTVLQLSVLCSRKTHIHGSRTELFKFAERPIKGSRSVLKFRGILFTHSQGDQKVSVCLMITIEKVTSNVQSVPSQSPDIY